jgi:hypothetical protein
MNRREFIQSGLTIASLAFVAGTDFAQAAILGSPSWGISLLPWNENFGSGLEFSKKLRPDFVFASGEILNQKDFKSEVWKASLKKAGSPKVGFWYGPVPHNFEDQTSETDRFSTFLDKAKLAAGKFVVVKASVRESYGPGLDKIRKLGSGLSAAGVLAKSRGLQLLFQNDYESMIRTPTELIQLLGATDRKNVQLAFDYAHFSLAGGNLASFLASSQQRIGLVLLKDLQTPFNRHDGKRSYNYRFTDPGVGGLDIAQLFASLKENRIKPVFVPDPSLPDSRLPEKITMDYLEPLKTYLEISL